MLAAQPGTVQSLQMQWEWVLGAGGGCALPSDDKDHGNSWSLMKRKQVFRVLKNSWGASAPKLELLAVQWSSSNLCKVGSYVAIGVIQQ